MKPTIYRITHLWPNKQPGRGLTAQIEEDRERWMIKVCRTCGFESLVRKNPQESALGHAVHAGKDGEATVEEVEVVPAPEDSSTVQIIPETDELDALPSRFVSLQDHERLERAANRVLILDDAEPSEDSEAHAAVIAELRAALSSEATKGET